MDLPALPNISPRIGGILIVSLVLITLLGVMGRVPIGYSLRNLRVRWLTTIMTGLAFTLVVGLLTVMLAFVNGMYKLNEQSGQPGNVIVLSQGATDEIFSDLGFSGIGDIERQGGVLRNDRDKPLASWEVYRVVIQPVQSATGLKLTAANTPKRRFTQIRGVDDPVIAAQVHGMELFPGGAWFSEAGVQEIPADKTRGNPAGNQAIQAVLGQGIAQQLGQDRGLPKLSVGDTFQLGPRTWVVTGIMKSAGTAFGSEVWAKRSIIGPLFGKETYSTIVLRTAGTVAAKSLAKDLTDNFKQANVSAQPETEYYARLSETNKQFTIALIFVTIVMAVGGMFGVMNTMLVAIAQRVKDIGVLRIVGFARWQVLTTFFLESLLIAVTGGMLGCALGYMADGWTATSVVSSGQGPGKTIILELIVTPNTLLVSMLVAIAMGAVGGLIPSISAMRLRPLESMR